MARNQRDRPSLLEAKIVPLIDLVPEKRISC
jgi:hypothetical protein